MVLGGKSGGAEIRPAGKGLFGGGMNLLTGKKALVTGRGEASVVRSRGFLRRTGRTSA